MTVKTEVQKMKWLGGYDSAIRKALQDCPKAPSWEHYPYGHMAMGQGLSPKTAARKYLDQTKFGKQSCRR